MRPGWRACILRIATNWRCDVDQILRSGNDYYQEFRVHHPERGERWIRGKGRIERNNAGAPVRFFGIDMDITERKVAELEIQKFVSLAENSTQFIGMCDMNYVLFYANNAALKIVGLESVSQLAGTPSPSFFFQRIGISSSTNSSHEFSVRVGPKWKSASGISRPASQCG